MLQLSRKQQPALINPYRHRQHKSPSRKSGNSKEPTTYWDNGALYRSCLDRFYAKESSRKPNENTYQPKPKVFYTMLKHPFLLTDHLTFRTSGKKTSIFQRKDDMDVRCVRVDIPTKKIHIMSSFVVIDHFPNYTVVGFDTMYDFYFKEPLTFVFCKITTRQMKEQLTPFLPNNLCAIVCSYIPSVTFDAVFSTNFTFDLPKKVATSKKTNTICDLTHDNVQSSSLIKKKERKLRSLTKTVRKYVSTSAPPPEDLWAVFC